MDDFQEIEPAPARHLQEVARLWSSYGPAMRRWAALDGGMTWKTVSGGEYLCRYRQNAETGKKAFKSLGRRSRETEKIYADFIAQRDGAKNTVLALRDRVVTAGRVAKAYGLARLPAKSGDLLRRLWLNSLSEDFTVFGGVALLAYELESGLLAPTELVKDDHLILVGARDHVPLEAIEKTYEAAAGGDCKVAKRRTGIHFQTPGTIGLEVRGYETILNAAEDADETDALLAASTLPPFVGVTVARDAQPLEIRVFDPRAYAMAAYALGRDEPIWSERARFASAVAGRLGLEFDPEHAAAFPGLVAGDSIDSPRI